MQSAAATASLPRPGSDAVVFCILCPGHFANTNKKKQSKKTVAYATEKEKKKRHMRLKYAEIRISTRVSQPAEIEQKRTQLPTLHLACIHRRNNTPKKKNGFPKTHATAHKHHMQHTPHAFSRVPAKLTPCVVDLPRGLITLSRSVASHVKVSWLHQLFSLWSYSHVSEVCVCLCVCV